MSENQGSFGSSVLGLAGAASSVAWMDLKLRYMYSTRPWKALAQGQGWNHPGILNRGGLNIGTKIGNIILPEGAVNPMLPRVRKFGRGLFAGAEDIGKLSFHEPTYRTLAASASAGKLTLVDDYAKIFNRAKWAVRIGTAGSLLSVAMIVSAFAPLAYHAGKGIVDVAKVLRVPMNRMNATDWGGQLAAGHMTGQAHTERQRSLQFLREAGVRGPSALGQEASAIHM